MNSPARSDTAIDALTVALKERRLACFGYQVAGNRWQAPDASCTLTSLASDGKTKAAGGDGPDRVDSITGHAGATVSAPSPRPMVAAEVRAQIDQLVALFAWRVDRDGGTGVEDLFAVDGAYVLDTHRLEGREQIRAFYDSRRRRGARTSRHLFVNLQLNEDDGGTLLGTCALLLHAADGEAPLPLPSPFVADYDDTYVREGGHWLFKERQVRQVFGQFPHIVKEVI